MNKSKKRDRNKDLYALIGSRIKQYRTTIEMSQEELAALSSLKRPSIALIEKGSQKLPIDRLFIIAKALKTEPAQLLPTLREISSDKSGEYPIVVHGAETLAVHEVSSIKQQLDNVKNKPGLKPDL